MRSHSSAFLHCFVCCAFLSVLTLFSLTCFGGSASQPDLPVSESLVSEEALQSAACEMGWSVDSCHMQYYSDNHILYNFDLEESKRMSVSTVLVDNQRYLTVFCSLWMLPQKPSFNPEDWQECLSFAELLYQGSCDNELFQALSAQDCPEPLVPEPGDNKPLGYECVDLDAELSYGYAKTHWYECAGEAEYLGAAYAIHNWRSTFRIELYESESLYKSMHAAP